VQLEADSFERRRAKQAFDSNRYDTSTKRGICMGPGLLAPTHIIMLALVALLIFGPKRLPEIARSLGHGLREFKDSVTADHHHDQIATAHVADPTPGLEHDSL
jgi:TatA/E family protein of Tat protein translocase